MRRVITFDIETVPHDCAGDYIQKPDLSAIQPAGNLKDPVKIAESIEKRQREALDEYETARGRAGLDWNLNRIVAIAWAENDGEPQVMLCGTEDGERVALHAFWAALKGAHDLIGFRARTFDVPTLIQRSRLLRVPYPPVSLARFGSGDVTDLYDKLTFDDARYEAIMPRSLKSFAKRFGIPVDDDISGSQIAELVAAGDWDGVRAHVTSDVRLTVALAVELGYIKAGEPVPVMTPEAAEVGF